METRALKIKTLEIRKEIIQMIFQGKTGHTGGALSATDIMSTLYYDVMQVDPAAPKWPKRDRFVLSKGHSVEPLWCILADLGFIDLEELKTFSAYGSRLIGHPNNKVPGVEMNTGSLGHGLPIACGMALSAKRSGESFQVYTLMGDGEQAEGSVWEGAMFAAHYQLDNLVAIVDRNKVQISGKTEDVMGLEPFEDKWRAFGWHVLHVDGNDVAALKEVLRYKAPLKPLLIIAHTIKGKGISFMEHQIPWHHKVPTTEEFQQAIKELDAAILALG